MFKCSEQLLFSCVSSKVSICNYVTCCMSHVTCDCAHVISIYKLEKVCVYVCVWPLLKLLDLAVLVALMLTETRREAILAVWVVLWGSGGKIRCVRPEPRGRRRRPTGARGRRRWSPATSPPAGRSPAVVAAGRPEPRGQVF